MFIFIMQVAAYGGQSRAMVAPVSGNDVGIRRAEIKDGIRQVVCCKDGEGRIGLRVRGVNKGLFVAFVHKDSPGNRINGLFCRSCDHLPLIS